MPYENTLKEYLDEDPERKVKLFKMYTHVLIISTFLIAFGVFMFILIEFGII
ncbi:hypothetical protein [Candidatus Methanosphaera massiliense]|jgi:hypothetical protein|uniref:hypothetical protein n=1 Tax=Methanosphaera TaxID=2316 RepID=UPI00238062A0|nr:hypothetical protein [Candidatus Methanosphaera massiliense]MDD6286315.1 hypothetical protein [Methanobacteriaceae archaeon]MDE4077520.1 hypothetical protein [Candidatus Methanosphaera massiliense]MDY2744171.1 hypothetical protein [Methanosphaera sp.]